MSAWSILVMRSWAFWWPNGCSSDTGSAGGRTHQPAGLCGSHESLPVSVASSTGRYLRMGRGEEASGGKEREANLCAAFEAFVGAIYLDRGLETTRALVGALLETRSAEIEQQRSKKNAKSYLQEYTQSAMQITPAYAIIAEHGPDHDRQFVARVMVGNETWGEGSGRSKQAAEQAAAAAAIEQRAL